MSEEISKEEKLKSIKEFTGDNDIELLEENDTFDFKCQQCGQCCMHRNDIVLNPFDIYNGAKYLGITPKEFLDKYASVLFGRVSKIPMITLKSMENGFCPLLKLDVKDGGKFKCTINPAKPGACSNHPIGVTWEKNVDTGETKMEYIKVTSCPNSQGHNEIHTVKEWVKPYVKNINEINVAHEMQSMPAKYFDTRKFYYLCDVLCDLFKDIEEDAPAEVKNSADALKELVVASMKTYLEATIKVGYTNYDISKPFIEQANENIEQMQNAYGALKLFYERTKESAKATGIDIDEIIKQIKD